MSTFIGTIKLVMNDEGVVQAQVQIRSDVPTEVLDVVKLSTTVMVESINGLAKGK